MFRKANSFRNKILISALCLVLITIVFLIGRSYQNYGNTDKNINVEELEIHFIQTYDDANCILLYQKDTAILIDTGEKQDAENIIGFLKEKNISVIDYMILTHPDKDHIGGAIDIIDNFSVQCIVQPYYDLENERKKQLDAKIEEENIKLLIPDSIENFSRDDLSISVYPPKRQEYDNDNNYSLAILVNHKDVNLLFTGDAKKKRLKELLNIKWPDIALYQVAYHGRDVERSPEFLEYVSPTYAVSTSSDSDESIEEVCKKTNTELFHSVKETVSFISNGSQCSKL